MTKPHAAALLAILGLAIVIVGYLQPDLIGKGALPYAYLSVMSAGAMVVILAALLWSDS